MVEKNREMFRFVKEMIGFRKRHPSLMRRRYVTGTRQKNDRLPDITWHGRKLRQPPWDDQGKNLLAFTLGGKGEEEDLHVMFNMSERPITFALPAVSGRTWHMAINTAASCPDDIVLPDSQIPLDKKFCKTAPRSVVVLECRP
jgi:glycogen operon protein